MKTTTSGSQSYIELLRHACNKRMSAEIELNSIDGETQFGRMRLLEGNNGVVYIDAPTHHGLPLRMNSDMEAVIYFVVDGVRYSFRSYIEEACMVHLDDQHTISGFSISIPDDICRDERRHDYRVSLARCVEVACKVRPTDAPEDHFFGARIMNISAGGMAAIAIDLNGHSVQKGGHFWLEFRLPKIKRTFLFKAQACHLRDLKGAGQMIGFKYLPESNAAEMRHAVRQISQFVAKELQKND